MRVVRIWRAYYAVLTITILVLICATVAHSQQDHLTPDEVQTALQSPAKKHHTSFIDMASVFGSEASNGMGHGSQIPGIDVYMPDSWIATQRDFAKKQYRAYSPNDDDTLRAVTVVGRGIATGTSAGPHCNSVTRIALISDRGGATVAEAVKQSDESETYRNGFGATASCSVVTAKFMLTDLARIQAAAGKKNFLIGVFYSDGSSKLYEVRAVYRKDLGI